MTPSDLIAKTIKGIKLLGIDVSLQAAIYPFRKTFYEAAFAQVKGAQKSKGSLLCGISAVLGKPPKETSIDTSYTFPGRVLAHRWNSAAKGPERQRVELTCENAMVRITVLAADLIRVRVNPSGRFAEPFSYAVAKKDTDWTPVQFTLEETAEAVLIRTQNLHCRVDKAYFALTFIDPDGTIVNADAAGTGWCGEKVACWKQLPPGEHLYGLGEKTTQLDKRGMTSRMWNTDPMFYHPGEDPIYANIPFYLGLNRGRGYGIFFDNSARGQFDFGATTPGITRFEADCGEMCIYFFYGPRLSVVLDRYTELTGRMIMPPLWALGYHQNRWSYYPHDRVREIAREFRTRRIPCEALHLDIEYMDEFRCFTWHPERFPDPGKLIADLHAQGYKVVTMVDPGIKVDPDYWVCQEGLEKDVFCKYPNGRLFSGPVWPGNSYFPDYTSPRVREWWGELYQGMVDLDVDGFWNDMNEPAVTSGSSDNTMPDVVQHELDGHGSDHRLAHNVYGMQMARATAEGLMQLRPDERPLVISRSLWAGSQRYNMHWLGDNYSDWESLRNTMQLVLNMGLSGIAFTGPDTGGFAGTPDGELLIRWNQMSVFTPFFRNHTAKGTADQEPWAFGEACERLSREFIELRYRLLPYLYTAFWQSAQTGMPIVRPLFLPFQDDDHVAGIDDQFMCGDAFLVAPVYVRGATARRAYIPQGYWYDFWSNALTAGPQITRLPAPIHHIPLLVRAGSIVPAWPTMQYIGEQPIQTLTLHVYPGNGTSLLYEDDGRTWAFRQGAYRLTEFRSILDGSIPAPDQLTIRRTCASPASSSGPSNGAPSILPPTYARIRIELHGIASARPKIHVDGETIPYTEFDADKRTMTFETGEFETIAVFWR